VLIIPLHKPLTAATFPYVTALLILVNVLVYFGWQGGDDARMEAATATYADARLDAVELPAYLAWRKAHGQSPPTPIDAPEEMQVPPALQAVLWIQADDLFLDDLHAGRVITPADAGYADWKRGRDAFERAWDGIFTERHMLRFSEFDVGRMFSAMFLHGSAGHLIGNMLFLGFLGLLVEGALGSRQFLALYLLGGLGGQLASLAYRWGDPGAALGASGAIAAMMGAYCVLWGRRPVRFFAWFFVVFDYLRAPALWLLPVWLGWEVVNLLFNDGAGIGFDAHAGGLASGALLAWGVVALKRERRAFLDEEQTAAVAEDTFPRALEHLGRLETEQARQLLVPLVQSPKATWDVRAAWYRCCRYDPARTGLDAAALAALQSPVTPAQRGERTRLLEDYLQAREGRPGFADADAVALARGWIEADAIVDADRLLSSLPGDAPALADAWLQLARAWQAKRDGMRARRACQEVLDRFPGSAAAAKAAFLLSAENA
jgi:membrane associated rhomboid family serine protease